MNKMNEENLNHLNFEDSQRKKGIYLLPNLFTVGALFTGFYAIVAATQGRFENAAIAIFVAILLDNLDGRTARLLNAVSDFGAQFDSLSDMVCFGVTPALVAYTWSLSSLGKPGWLIAFIYATCTALRLARFNSQSGMSDRRFFYGLATPASAGYLASLIWLSVDYHVSGNQVSPFIAVIVLFLSFLKVSTIPYRSFKDFDIRGKVPFMVIPAIALIFVFISFSPPFIFALLLTLYILYGPIFWLIRRNRLKQKAPLTASKVMGVSSNDHQK